MNNDQQYQNRRAHLVADFQNDLFGPGGMFEDESDDPQRYEDHAKETRGRVGEKYAQKIDASKPASHD